MTLIENSPLTKHCVGRRVLMNTDPKNGVVAEYRKDRQHKKFRIDLLKESGKRRGESIWVDEQGRYKSGIKFYIIAREV